MVGNRVNGLLGVSRALGDFELKDPAVSQCTHTHNTTSVHNTARACMYTCMLVPPPPPPPPSELLLLLSPLLAQLI